MNSHTDFSNQWLQGCLETDESVIAILHLSFVWEWVLADGWLLFFNTDSKAAENLACMREMIDKEMRATCE